MQIIRGQRLKLTDIGLGGMPFNITIGLPSSSLNIDVACFGLDAGRKLAHEPYMTFYNQPSTPCGAVKLDGSLFQIDLARLPASIDALVLTMAIDGPGVMSMLGSGQLVLRTHGGSEVANCAIEGSSFANERALMLLEIYRKDGAWRTCFIGQGFNGGLDALIRHFGGSVTEAPSPSAPIPPPLPATQNEVVTDYRIAALENRITHLGIQLEQAKTAAQTWVNASSSLSCNAAEARAKNQGAGRGILGGLLGSKYRSAVRAGAAASNAKISQQVARKRSEIANGKRQAQEVIKEIKSQIATARAELKQIGSANTEKSQNKMTAKAASDSISLLHKLKEAHKAGLLTAGEYEEKRRKLLEHL